MRGFEHAVGHALQVAVFDHPAEPGMAHDIVIREPGFADHRQAGSQIVVDLAALVVVHRPGGREDDADRREMQVVPRCLIGHRAAVADEARIQVAAIAGPDHVQLRAPGKERLAQSVQAFRQRAVRLRLAPAGVAVEVAGEDAMAPGRLEDRDRRAGRE